MSASQYIGSCDCEHILKVELENSMCVCERERVSLCEHVCVKESVCLCVSVMGEDWTVPAGVCQQVCRRLIFESPNVKKT